MFCPKCGKQIPDGAKFCPGCGNKVQISGGNAQQVKKPDGNMQQTKKSGGNVQQAKKPDGNVQQMTKPDRDVQQIMTPETGYQQPQNTRKAGNKNRTITIILSIVLAILILAAAGLGIYYFKALGEESRLSASEESDREEEDVETEEQDEEEDSEEKDKAADEDGEGVPASEAPAEEAAEEQGVVSDTNEVVAETILYNIPKSVYSYQFDEDLGNAKAVVRTVGDSMPEIAENLEVKYVPGMDGKAVYLDGTYGILLSDVGRIGTSYTVAFWMKADDLQDWSPFIHIGHDLLDSENRARLWLGQKTDSVSVAPIISSESRRTADSFEIRPGNSAPNSIDPGVWYHIAFTVDGSRQGSRKGSVLGTLYVAGRYICEGDIVPDMMNTDNFEVYLGINCWDALYPVAFDDVKIWDQVLDGSQIQELYNAYE